jgi:3-hydroxyisobutyrate dehydrogenase-like beta-hydroxyacid dehydrogenase
MVKIGFVGLGNMGAGVCHNLIKAGHDLIAYDISEAAGARFEGKCALAKDLREVAEFGEYIFMSLPKSEIVEEVVESFLATDIRGKTIIDLSTSYPLSTQALAARVSEAGGTMIDAPFNGGPTEAMAGTLTSYVGGDESDYDRLAFLFDAYCVKHVYTGEAGSGHMAKLALNYCSLSTALVIAQIYPIMEKLGWDREKTHKLVSGGGNGLANWIVNFYGKKYSEESYHLDFALSLGMKDLSYMKRIYEELNVPGFMLDRALDLCRVSLLDQKPGEVLDMSYPCHMISRLAGLADE